MILYVFGLSGVYAGPAARLEVSTHVFAQVFHGINLNWLVSTSYPRDYGCGFLLFAAFTFTSEALQVP
jgi:hypothetical protein